MSDRYGSLKEDSEEPAAYVEHDGLIREEIDDNESTGDDEEIEFSIQELLYSSASYYAIAKPVTLTMVLAAAAVCFVNDDATRSEGAAAMAAYQTWNPASGNVLALSFANALVMVTGICCMTFGIVLLYKFKCMSLIIGYMVLASTSLLGLLGGHLLMTALSIYQVPLDKISFVLLMFNFAVVGVAAVFWGKGIPKIVTQGYLIATSVILAWHLSYFDDWTAWSLLLMLALYDLCAVLTPCGPLKALVNLMSQDDAPEMPGLLFEAELPQEAKRRKPKGATENSAQQQPVSSPVPEAQPVERRSEVKLPLAIAKVYQLPVLSIPDKSIPILYPNATDVPLLAGSSDPAIPDDPSPKQLQTLVVVRLPPNGGTVEQVSRKGKKVYLERDRHGQPKRILWVDSRGKVFAEVKGDDDDAAPDSNSIRLGLGDFIFYSVLVAKAAQHSFTTFAACTLVILAGLGGTLVLLSVYGHALPALPISIFLGVVIYITTRLFLQPWLEVLLKQPFYI